MLLFLSVFALLASSHSAASHAAESTCAVRRVFSLFCAVRFFMLFEKTHNIKLNERRLLLVDNKQIIKVFFLRHKRNAVAVVCLAFATDNRPRKKSLLALAFAT